MNSLVTEPDVAGVPTTSGLFTRKIAAGAVTAAALAAAASLWIGREPAAAAPPPAVPQAIRNHMAEMSTGTGQDLVASGTTAESRNAAIPLTVGALASMSGFTQIARTDPQYATALKCLTQAVYYEAANEPELGKRAVAQVVLNRLRHPEYPNSVCGVVYQGSSAPVCQFSFTCDGSLLRAPMARQWAQSRAVAEQALAGSVVAEVGSATHYHADYVLPRWAFTLGKLQKIGVHIFYRFPGAVGNAAVFRDGWSAVERIPSLDIERLREALANDVEITELTLPEIELVPNLTVAPDVKDRHAQNDVGGRLNTTTGWQLSIPDPVQLSAEYKSAVAEQGAGGSEGAAVAIAGASDAPAKMAE